MVLKDTKIGIRLTIGLGVVVGILSILMVLCIITIKNINDKLNGIVTMENKKIELAHIIKDELNNVDKGVLTTVVVQNRIEVVDKVKARLGDARTKYVKALEELEKIEDTGEGKKLIEEFKKVVTPAREANSRTVELVLLGNTNEALNVYLTNGMPAALKLNEICDELAKYQEKHILVRLKEANDTYRTIMILLIGGGACAILLAIFIIFFITKSITRPLQMGVEVTNQLAQGDLTEDLTVEGRDETGQLLSTMKKMVENLRNIVKGIKETASNVASASHQLSASSGQMSKGAKEQAAMASQVATASEEMAQTSVDIAKNAANIATSATKATQNAREGEKTVENVIEEINNVANLIADSSNIIHSLGDNSRQIGEIVNVINEIADQTNLLALNAAIEAARAGEHGRGFAVVADEVRKLADKTVNSISEIDGMIKSIQDMVEKAISSMKVIEERTGSSVELSSRTGKLLKGIVSQVDELHIMVQQIASATEEMTGATKEISKDIESIAGVSKDTSQSSDQIAQAASELARFSENLQNMVEGFKVEKERLQ